eukprot:15330899-Ditylum_brightwellii.AAC.1
MTRNGAVISCITIQPMTEEEMRDVETQKDMTEFDKFLGAEPDRVIFDDGIEDYLKENWQPNEEEAVKPDAEDDTPDEVDKYISAHAMLP